MRELTYTATGNNTVFTVTRGDNRIISHQPWYNTDAVLRDPVLMWVTLPKFESFIQAVRYLKANLNNLI